MKVSKKSRMQHRLSWNGYFLLSRIDRFVPVEGGTINIEALMNFTPEQHKWLESMFYITMGYLNKNLKVELGKFGTLEAVLDCEMCELQEGEELSTDSIKKIRLKLKESKDAKKMLEEIKDTIEIV